LDKFILDKIIDMVIQSLHVKYGLGAEDQFNLLYLGKTKVEFSIISDQIELFIFVYIYNNRKLYRNHPQLTNWTAISLA
jgi:hypothetical protein